MAAHRWNADGGQNTSQNHSSKSRLMFPRLCKWSGERTVPARRADTCNGYIRTIGGRPRGIKAVSDHRSKNFNLHWVEHKSNVNIGGLINATIKSQNRLSFLQNTLHARAVNGHNRSTAGKRQNGCRWHIAYWFIDHWLHRL